MTTTPDAVDQIVAILSDVEALASQAKNKLDDLPALFRAINENGDAGELISKASSLRAKSLGLGFKSDVLQFHSDLTEAAKQRGIDVPGIFGSGGR